MLEYYKRWKNSYNRDLYCCYKNPSKAKIEIWEYILKYFYFVDDGFDIKIITYNQHQYTIGYIYENINYSTREKITYFKVITKQNIQEIIVCVEAF